MPGTNHNVLVAYFSEPLPDGVDASTSASRVIVNGDLYGSVEYMAMYSFFDEYDFTGKTLIPFSSHGGSGWSGTVDDIAGMEPNATMVDGYSISRNSVAGSADGIREWLGRIGMSEQ